MKRFWDKVKKSDDTDGCWEWKGSQTNGVGTLWFNNKNNKINRFAWELVNGPVPAKTFVLRKCDNSLCVNPEHLYLRKMGDLENRFWEKIKKNEHGCWDWIGAKDWDGNGQFWFKNRMMCAHRIVWEKWYGPIPKDRAILRSCNNPKCVKPSHLYLKAVDDEIRFWKNVKKTKSGCWEWLGALNSHGYGEFYINREHIGAHRFSWKLKYGAIPNGLYILHHCDNRKCVNPEHLFLGRNKENQIDCIKKGRHSNVKLSVDIAREIRRLYADKVLNQAQLSNKYGVSISHISRIIRNKKWKEEDYLNEYGKYQAHRLFR